MLNDVVYIAGTRFGLGLRADDVSRIGGSPQEWLMQQIRSPQVISPAFATLPSAIQNMQYVLKTGMEIKQEDKSDKKDAQKEMRSELKDVLLNEMSAKLELAITTPTPFYERLVGFWSNHFSVSVKKGKIAGLVGAFEREAIRPYVTGKFSDMLLAVAHHPAMLLYLDNAQSIGPGSRAGEKSGKGLNENLAREIMELHTLGVDGGYSQTDVTSFAKIITGWTIGKLDSDNPGGFTFMPKRHEPGTQYIMGRSYPDDGESQGVAVLRDLAANPATAHHIATKLARHFIADAPPADAVARLADMFTRSGGDMVQLYDALVALTQAWDIRTYPKIKGSYDLIVSAARVSSAASATSIEYCLKSLKFLGDAPFTANSPAGIPDTMQDIAGPDAMIRRVEWAQMAAVKFAPVFDVGTLEQLAAGPFLSPATHDAIGRAKNSREAVAILFGSPEFQRR